MLCRVCRTWNQTGDKWSHLPDVGDWLVRPENKAILSLAVIASLSVINFTKWRTSPARYLFLLGSFGVYCFRVANNSVILPFLYHKETLSKGVIEARTVYGIITVMLCNTVYKCYKFKTRMKDKKNKYQEFQTDKFPPSVLLNGIQSCFMLLMILLVRPHNICLCALVFLQEHCLSIYLLKAEGRPFSASVITLLYYWMGQAAFYYQGNSNSISTVDVSSGYIGLTDYQPVLIGILMCLSTYAGPIFWIISLIRLLITRHTEAVHESYPSDMEDIHNYTPKYAAHTNYASGSGISQYQASTSTHISTSKTDKCDITQVETSIRKSLQTDFLEVCYVLVLCKALPLSIYTVLVTIQRYHLFVWTVFSPKLLYEGMHTLVISVLVLFIFLFRMTLYTSTRRVRFNLRS